MSEPPILCDADLRVLDFLAEHGFDASRVNLLPEADRPRAMALIRQMSVLDAYPADGGDDSLVDATLARIAAHDEAVDASRRIGFARPPAFRLADLVSVAAVVLLLLGVTVPMIANLRAQKLSTLCASNLRAVHGALGSYASSNAGALPLRSAVAGFGGMFAARPGEPNQVTRLDAPAVPPAQAQRLRPGVPQMPTQLVIEFRRPGTVIRIVQGVPSWAESNHSAHLSQLVDAGYCGGDHLRCPACAAGRPCFAYRVPSRGGRFMLDTPSRTVVVADANPVIEDHRSGRHAGRAINSRNHRGEGQNLLFCDGAVEWSTTPLQQGGPGGMTANSWLPQDELGRDRMQLRSWPGNAADNFVAQ
ncbi:MAG: hypothetical protein ACKOQW_01555 [Phycisphaerales bacterium]